MTALQAVTTVVTDGTFVSDNLELTWHVSADPYQLGLDALAGLALRDNPKRAHLIVSKVLAKHIPARPGTVRAAGLLLAGLVHEHLGERRDPRLDAALLTDPDRSSYVNSLAGSLPGDPIVIGYCETATALGHTVADAFSDATYLHTTRHPHPEVRPLLTFDEAHSHAVAHYLQPLGTLQLERDAPVVLVDDELTTGSTALNTIERLLEHRDYPQFVIATLLDMRTDAARQTFTDRAATLGVPVHVVALLDGHLTLPPDLLQRAAPLRAHLHASALPAAQDDDTRYVDARWPSSVPFTARHRFTTTDRAALDQQVRRLATELSPVTAAEPAALHGNGPVLVLGTEECMIAAIRLGHELELLQPGRIVRVQSTTRSPVLPHQAPGYAIQRAVTFTCPTDPARDSFLYNVAPLDHPDNSTPPYQHIVVVTDAPAHQLAALTTALRPYSEHPVHALLAHGAS